MGIEVRVLVDDFYIGLTHHEKGSNYTTSLPAANYLSDEGKVKIIGSNQPGSLDDILDIDEPNSKVTPVRKSPAAKKTSRVK